MLERDDENVMNCFTLYLNFKCKIFHYIELNLLLKMHQINEFELKTN